LSFFLFFFSLIRALHHLYTRAANLGQCFVALNPALFAGGFNERMGDLMHQMRSLPHVDPALPVLVPGGASIHLISLPTRANADMGLRAQIWRR
jgi:LDH2 family malate/lactate/ureidoglycolate dehydrogenase